MWLCKSLVMAYVVLVTSAEPESRQTPTSCASLSGTVPTGCTQQTYTVPTNYPATGTGRRNPERGFYVHTETKSSSWDPVPTLSTYVNQGYTLILRNIILNTFVTSNISATILQKIKDDFVSIRNARMKVVLRFCYSVDSAVVQDAAPLQLQKHLQQLKPIFQANADVIHVVQAGFIGVWGEWYYTNNYGNNGIISSSNWEKRRQVVYQLLDALPTSRQIQLRTPNFKRTILNRTTPLTSAEAQTTARVARIGHHNDCFLASSDDYGTYLNKAVEYPYLQTETLYLAQGGETCSSNPPRSDCTTALKEMSELHFNYLNSGYEPTVLASWKTGGCFNQIDNSMGYRLVGVLARLPTQVGVGSNTNVGVRIKNIGWAAPINYRSAQLVIRHSTTSTEYKSPFATSIDLRKWLPGDRDLTLTLSVPSSAAVGKYKVYLSLPDGATSLQTMPEYNIVMENLVDTSLPSLRRNLLGTITVA